MSKMRGEYKLRRHKKNKHVEEWRKRRNKKVSDTKKEASDA